VSSGGDRRRPRAWANANISARSTEIDPPSETPVNRRVLGSSPSGGSKRPGRRLPPCETTCRRADVPARCRNRDPRSSSSIPRRHDPGERHRRGPVRLTFHRSARPGSAQPATLAKEPPGKDEYNAGHRPTMRRSTGKLIDAVAARTQPSVDVEGVVTRRLPPALESVVSRCVLHRRRGAVHRHSACDRTRSGAW
jgi:hypothetical protein